jgi:hypothetical protein
MLALFPSSLTAVLLTAWASPNLLSSAKVVRDEQILRSAVIRDGRLTAEGEFWDSELTAIVRPQGVLELDLGKVTHIGAGLLQADNNDDYLVWGSTDGLTFKLLWRPETDPDSGMRTRISRSLDAEARFIRLTAEGGDGMYSVSELQLFSAAAELTDASINRAPPTPPAPPPGSNSTTWLLIAAATVAAVAFLRSRHGKPSGTPPA